MNKSEQRKYYTAIRNSILPAEKVQSDENIFKKIIASDFYIRSQILLVYVSFGSEIDTQRIIKHSLSAGKRVAVPFCVGKKMLFYEIGAVNELVKGKFGIPTVDPADKSPVSDFNGALCVVPGVCFDLNGNRIGYGGGYYDRFLSENSIVSLGVCYEKCLCSEIKSEEFDIKTDYVLTENGFVKF